MTSIIRNILIAVYLLNFQKSSLVFNWLEGIPTIVSVCSKTAHIIQIVIVFDVILRSVNLIGLNVIFIFFFNIFYFFTRRITFKILTFFCRGVFHFFWRVFLTKNLFLRSIRIHSLFNFILDLILLLFHHVMDFNHQTFISIFPHEPVINKLARTYQKTQKNSNHNLI